ncbi:riboflavin synthase subunit alpha [candidate division WOR-1 bacterium RIFOXYB2_FULL_42_35]|uniref:Riboflavin synthase n=1 Tax=candidate division WOR-1 bacterium RIFOXYC2_FULL_41_25 TaxID=1802586 RepID=A0A1F4TNP5_UNCSA|nr:MAG: riboflavin synthase subunit alpha [candidate division WOR-1 bacterium RIFOXYA2_FULL_41_14]OGC24776.1 MAG: riboflavin synthase subunit alpha [candidate division WOR-1 bacterium RIFOXYB2_FULL_42_35]OGC34335.1 MAG: riboflavin synthase subunit alpha [candidate division WOR-1 bacterium RIFOXYC2_FULL_41_25]OGC43322.1 MAG: riboflavin synthase subunit alpha [candidate division WOR-1 bacterium RIFOXYD2_FULL_41_8]
MFTGLIEEVGVVTSFVRSSLSAKLTISVSREFADVQIGESIAVNGTCLTVTKIRRNLVEFDVAPETLRISTITDLKVRDRVNLERALLLSARLGGHLVTGHVDGIGEIRKKVKLDKTLELSLSIPSKLLAFIVPKGSITIDGISLTLADMRDGLLIISVIPHTANSTTLADKDVGDRVNVEVDILSKYIEKHLKGEMNRGVSDDMLTKAGFFPLGWIDN